MNLKPGASDRFKRQFLHADFRSDERLNIDLSGNTFKYFTAERWPGTTARVRTMYVLFNVACMVLCLYAAVGFYLLGIHSDGSMRYVYAVLALGFAFNTWFLTATLIWMFRSRAVPAKQVRVRQDDLLTPQWDVADKRMKKASKY